MIHYIEFKLDVDGTKMSEEQIKNMLEDSLDTFTTDVVDVILRGVEEDKNG